MMERELGEGYSFTKKKCFVCGSLSHLIKDCDYYEKKMAREAEVKKQRVVNTVQVNTGRTNINSVRPNINTGRTNVNPVRPRVNTGSSNVNSVRSRKPVPTKTSNSFSPKRPQGNWGSAVKTSAGYNWRNSNPNSNCDSGPTFIRTDHPLKNMVDRGIFDSGCSGHMTENKHPYLAVTLTKKIFGNMKRGFRGAPRPLLPAMLLVATTNPNAGQEHPDVAQSQPSSSTIPVPSTSLPPHTFEEPYPTHQHFSPLQEHAQEQMSVDDLLQLVPQLMTRVDSLEKDLKQTKLTMGSVIVKLVKKVKKLEGILKRKNMVFSDSEEEEPEDQGRKSQDDPLVSLVQMAPAKTLSRVSSQKPKSIDKGRRYKRRKETKRKKVVTSLDFQEEVSTAKGVNTGSIKVSTVSGQVSTDSINKSIPSPDKGQREGKAPMIIEEAPKKTKEQNSTGGMLV
ncbi:hypothetical protein Tco_1508818 [Tanacetum coccineum]